ncbi:hypothetical protein MMC25_008318 [Agyrium rufum]|nr:hypothetical protein [Agyrium rufum]
MFLPRVQHHESHLHPGTPTPENNRQLRSRASIATLANFVRSPVGTVSEVVDRWRDGLTAEERLAKQKVDDRKQILYCKLRHVRIYRSGVKYRSERRKVYWIARADCMTVEQASNYDDWQAAATELDELEGNNEWKQVFESSDCDSELIEARLKQLDQARLECDIGRMLFLVRTAFTRNLGNMGNVNLYKHSHVGTKHVIERYIESALATLDALLDVSGRAGCDGPETRHILDQVISTRQAFGRSALLLSGGATFGMNHIGVLKALWDASLLPRIISGASAGSIVCAVLCTRTDEEVPEVMETFCYGDLAVFEEEGNEDTVLRKVARFLKHGSLFDISHLVRVMKEMLGDLTFQEAYNRTRRILNICVSSASLYELPRLLNYVTAPNVLIWSAVAASCSVPFLFSPASLLVKDPKTGAAIPWNPSPQHWIDGSVDNDLPMTRLAEMFNVNHFIVSQVNPHVVPFLDSEEDSLAGNALRSVPSIQPAPTWLHTLTDLAKGEALHRMRMMAEMGIFPTVLTKTISVMSQKYSGDITILPEITYSEFPRMLSNPTPEFMEQSMHRGLRATWPKLSRIQNHCAIELALDGAIHKLRARTLSIRNQAELRSHARSGSTALAAKERLMQYRSVDGTPENMGGVHKLNTHVPNSSRRLKPRTSAATIPSLKYSRSSPGHHPSLSHPPITRSSTGSSEEARTNSIRLPLQDRAKEVPRMIFPEQGEEPIELTHRLVDAKNPKDSTDYENANSESDPASELSPTNSSFSPDYNAASIGSRPLFPFASQPTTPAASRFMGSFLPILPSHQSATSDPQLLDDVQHLIVRENPSSRENTLMNSPTASPKVKRGAERTARISQAEATYKKIFHRLERPFRPDSEETVDTSNESPYRNRELHSSGDLNGPADATNDQDDRSSVTRLNTLGLKIDISGTRGMVLRKKSSRCEGK